MSKPILSAFSILVALTVVWLLWSPDQYTSTDNSEFSEGFQAFIAADLEEATRIVLKKGTGRVELKKAGDGWVVESSYGYPANVDQVVKMIKSLGKIKSGEEVGTSTESHEDLEVNAEKGGFVTLYDKSDKELVSVVVGKFGPGGGVGASKIFVRFGNDESTYSVESNIRSDTRFYNEDIEAKNYLETEVVNLPDDVEIEMVRLVRPDKPDLIVERRSREVPVEDDSPLPADAKEDEGKEGEKEAEEKEPETETETYYVVTSGSEVHEVGKSEELTAQGFVNRGESVRIDDAVDPKELSEYGLDDPQLQALIHYRKKDAPDAKTERFALTFGNEKKNEKGDTDGYYVVVEDEAHKGMVYVIASYTFDSWNKEMKDFLPKPEEPEEPEKPEEPEEPEKEGESGEVAPPEGAAPAAETGAEGAETGASVEETPPEPEGEGSAEKN